MLPFDYHTLLLYLYFHYFIKYIFTSSVPRELYRVDLALDELIIIIFITIVVIIIIIIIIIHPSFPVSLYPMFT